MSVTSWGWSMTSRHTVRARRQLVVAATVLVAVLAGSVAAAYLFELNLDRRQGAAVEEHLLASELLGSVLAEQNVLELYYDAADHESDEREEALTKAFDPESSLQLIGGLVEEHGLLHARFGGEPDARVDTIEERFDALALAARNGAPLSSDVSERVTWRLLNFDLTTSVTQARQWHAEHFDVEAALTSALRSNVRIGLLAVLLIGVLVGVIVLVRLLRILRVAEQNEDRTKAALRARHYELQHALAKARTASEAKTRFVANTSHELRTPLTAILGFTDVLIESDLAPENLDHLTHIHSNADHLLQLIDDVLDISRIESGEVTLNHDNVDVPSLLEQIVMDLGRLASGRPVKVVADIPATAGTFVTDRVKLRQIVMNLVGNAIKFTEEGAVTISLHLDDDGIPSRIDVVDTGIGISSDLIEAVREPFRQADDERTRRFGGAGLGLPISLGLAEVLGYHLDISSELGVGSTFSLSLRPLPDQDTGAEGRRSRLRGEAHQEHPAGPSRLPPTPTAASEGYLEGDPREPAKPGGVDSSNAPMPAATSSGRAERN